ncbi:hypothetical protein OG239_00135 [Streptomyces sp. NBC_00868]|uniref:hypothetical protein n=1 Tax=unclassified Streptomyces TaxID=2593676 RepID=UPI00324A6132|nr:hypothetical protein OG239_00135 [Streptomyces sp. NBC_00868]
MTPQPGPPAGLSPADLAEYRHCQDEHFELREQIADREAQIEAGLIDTYDDYPFTWEPPQRQRRPAHNPASEADGLHDNGGSGAVRPRPAVAMPTGWARGNE